MSDHGSHDLELDELKETRLDSDTSFLQSEEPGSRSMNNGSALNGDNKHDLDRRVRRKLDFILLPFLALLFLFNSLDKSNIGNAETANFTRDAGLQPDDLNTAVAIFYAFFVTLQPVGAALGRKYGMKRWVPSCMLIWGVSTLLHCVVRRRWQLILLRAVIGILEAGFYPTTVSYLSLFYTRFEFGRRLAIFYGQSATAGALGGILAWAVFSRFPSDSPATPKPGVRPWQLLFIIEGSITMVIALLGFFWLPHSAKTAWFLTSEERDWAEERIRRDLEDASITPHMHVDDTHAHAIDICEQPLPTTTQDAEETGESHGLLTSTASPKQSLPSHLVTDDRGLTRHDVLSALLDWKLWFLLICNILSSLPYTAFGIFMPILLKSASSSFSASSANLLTVPPFLCGGIVMFLFTRWSDKARIRLIPILWGLGILALGLAMLTVAPSSGSWILWKYLSLCVLTSGTYVPSPLTVAWLSGNTPSPGKRSIMLGVNGYGNLAGVFASLLFHPRYAPGYRVPCAVTLGLVIVSICGYALFKVIIGRVNDGRRRRIEGWSVEAHVAEAVSGKGPLPYRRYGRLMELSRKFGFAERAKEWLEMDQDFGREGDGKLTYQYGL